MNPDLLPIPGDVQGMNDAQKSVARAQAVPLPALTLPMSNTKGIEDRVYTCSVPFASMHRNDGKKLPFVKGFLKTRIVEDINFLDNEITNGNPYIKAGTEEDIVACELVYNPMAAVEHRVRKNLEVELRAEIEEKLRMEMDAAKLAGVDGVNVNQSGTKQIVVPRLNPVSSSDLAGASAVNTQAAVAARLASINAGK